MWPPEQVREKYPSSRFSAICCPLLWVLRDQFGSHGIFPWVVDCFRGREKKLVIGPVNGPVQAMSVAGARRWRLELLLPQQASEIATVHPCSCVRACLGVCGVNPAKGLIRRTMAVIVLMSRFALPQPASTVELTSTEIDEPDPATGQFPVLANERQVWPAGLDTVGETALGQLRRAVTDGPDAEVRHRADRYMHRTSSPL